MITPVNGFILLKQKEKNTEGKIVYQGDKNLCENEFEVIDVADNVENKFPLNQAIRNLAKGDIIIKGPHSGDIINVDGEELWMIRSEHILGIKK